MINFDLKILQFLSWFFFARKLSKDSFPFDEVARTRWKKWEKDQRARYVTNVTERRSRYFRIQESKKAGEGGRTFARDHMRPITGVSASDDACSTRVVYTQHTTSLASRRTIIDIRQSKDLSFRFRSATRLRIYCEKPRPLSLSLIFFHSLFDC